jgi:pyruvate dehydrogenase E1 component
MPPMPQGCEEGILKGMYRLKDVAPTAAPVAAAALPVQLLGSGAILREVIRAADLLAEHWGIASTVWSVTSWKELRREAQACRRWNMLHPDESPKRSYLESLVGDAEGVFVAASDHVRAVQEQLDPWVPGGIFALGTDGFGRSETRGPLRRHFEVDAECIAIGALWRLAETGAIGRHVVAEAIRRLGVNPDKIDAALA